MRLLSNFKFPHQRAKSDPTEVRYSTVRCLDLSGPILSTTLPSFSDASGTSSDPSARILNLETENGRIFDILAASINELADAKAQLSSCREAFHAELHKQRKENEQQNAELRKRLARWETFLELAIIANPNEVLFVDAYIDLLEGHTIDHAISTALDNIIETTSANTSGALTSNKYISALQLTLKSRRQLKQCKKIAKFWKSVAKDSERSSNLVTPSVSSISSILDVLPAERQKALDELTFRRRNFTQANSTWPLFDEPREHPEVATPQEPLTAPELTTHGEPTSAHMRLPPLASNSLRQEINNVAHLSSFSTWSHVRTTRAKLRPKPVDHDSQGMSFNSRYKVNGVMSGLGPTPAAVNPMTARTQRLKGRMRAKGYGLHSRLDSFAPSYMGTSILERVSDESHLLDANEPCDDYIADPDKSAIALSDVTKGTNRKIYKYPKLNLNVEMPHHTVPRAPSLRRKVSKAKSKLPMPVFPSLVKKLSVTEHCAKGGKLEKHTRLPVRIKY